jgi:pyruvate dehydrogenase E2 component (dihydrolipoamide acetyltransferase)
MNMPVEITMPRLSDTMEEGTLVKWRVKVGAKVKPGDLLADVETDKATMELQAFDEGTVAKLVVEEGETAAVGKLILVLAEKGEDVKQVAQAVKVEASVGAKGGDGGAGKQKAGGAGVKPSVVITGAGAMEPPVSQGAGRVRVSPLARKLAEEHGVDIGRVKGTGPDGRVIKRDVLAVADDGAGAAGGQEEEAGAVAAGGVRVPVMGGLGSKVVPVSNRRKTIARRLVESKTTIPHFTVTVAVDVGPLVSLRGTLNEQLASQGVKLSVNDFMIRAAALALTRHGYVNSSWTEGGIQLHGAVNVGTAVSIPEEKGGGVVVPTIRHADQKGLRAISAEVRALAGKARDQGLSAEDMSEGTFSVSNLGMYGVEHFEGIINPPQAAILAVGAAVDKAVVRNGRVEAGHEMALTLSCDHRVIDGAMGAEFLRTVKQMLENPASLLV